jgi:uncharacterized membrane protein
MVTLEHKIEIKAPVDKIWNILINLEEVAEYNTYIKSVRCISEEKRVGASRECLFKLKGFAKERITAIDEMKSLSMEMYESDFPLKFMRWTYYLSSKNGITSLKTITEYKVKYGLLGLLLNQLIMKSKFNKTMEEVFLSFKKYAESI